MWNDSLKMAIAPYMNGDNDLNECARVYGVPKATIKRHADFKNTFYNWIVIRETSNVQNRYGKIIVYRILLFEKRFFGLTNKDVAEKYDIAHTFNKDKEKAGKNGSMPLWSEIQTFLSVSHKQPIQTTTRTIERANEKGETSKGRQFEWSQWKSR